MYYVFQYRKKVTYLNLKNSFPDKSEKELRKLSRSYYRFLCDVFLETFKLLTISKNTLTKRVQFTDQFQSIFDDFYSKNVAVVSVMGHLGNWEWAGASFPIQAKNNLFALYHPLSNSNFNALMLKIRTRFGGQMIPMKQLLRFVPEIKDSASVLCFIADQTPPPEHAVWLNFLNQDTPFFKGPAVLAKKMNWPVIFVSVERISRGQYLVDAELISDSSSSMSESEILKAWVSKLEKKIESQPAYWLWSHKRWKHQRKINS
jgi:KDO2-lipid IV(A) lauroyltransferase